MIQDTAIPVDPLRLAEAIPETFIDLSKPAGDGPDARVAGWKRFLPFGLGKPQLAIVTELNFWFIDRGSRSRVDQLVRELSRDFRVRVFVTVPLTDADRARIARARIPATVHSFEDFDASTSSGCERRKGELFPFERKRFNPKVAAGLEAFLRRYRPEAAMIVFIGLSYLRLCEGLPEKLCLDTSDLNGRRKLSFERFGQQHPVDIEEPEEMAILAKFPAVLAIQRHDHQILGEQIGAEKSFYVPHSLPVVPRGRTPRGDFQILYVATSNPVNVQAFQWFLDQVWPHFAGRGVTLNAVGSLILAYEKANIPGVVFKGVVDDLALEYRAASIAINPVYYGGGLKIKSVESMAYGVPLLTTPEGARGIPRTDPPACLVAKSREEFIARLEELIDNPDLREALSVQGQRLIAAEYSNRHARNFSRWLRGS